MCCWQHEEVFHEVKKTTVEEDRYLSFVLMKLLNNWVVKKFNILTKWLHIVYFWTKFLSYIIVTCVHYKNECNRDVSISTWLNLGHVGNAQMKWWSTMHVMIQIETKTTIERLCVVYCNNRSLDEIESFISITLCYIDYKGVQQWWRV